MDGFYQLARVFGGVQVCLRHAVHDINSGADFPAGNQHLDAAQALAFVRQRDGLPNGDLDRTHRQQAFLDSVTHQLRTEGVLGDLTKMKALLSAARQYVITDAGWNLLDFATEAQGLTDGNLVFRTLPIQGYATISGQDANVVSPPALQAIVHAAFYPAPGPRPVPHQRPATVDVLNGGATAGLAGRVSAALAAGGYRAGQVGNTSPRAATAVLYGRGSSAPAATIARLFGAAATASSSVAAGHIRVLLGARATRPDVPRAGRRGAGLRYPVHRPAGRRGNRQERHSLRELIAGPGGRSRGLPGRAGRESISSGYYGGNSRPGASAPAASCH